MVLKPLDMLPDLLAWQAAVLTSIDGDADIRVSPPRRSASGELVVDGWTAWRFEPGEHRAGSWHDVIEAGARLHAALAGVTLQQHLRARPDPWSVADRVAWGEQPLPREADVPLARDLLSARQSLAVTCQVIHGDLTGNVLFADGLPPAVIDLSPYWRPPLFATAVVLVDALVWEGADDAILSMHSQDPALPQMLLRALAFRLVTALLREPGRSDEFAPTAGLVLDLVARHDRPRRK